MKAMVEYHACPERVKANEVISHAANGYSAQRAIAAPRLVFALEKITHYRYSLKIFGFNGFAKGFYRDAGSGLFIRGTWNFPLEIQRFPNKGFLEFGLKTRCSGGILIKTKHLLSLFI